LTLPSIVASLLPSFLSHQAYSKILRLASAVGCGDIPATGCWFFVASKFFAPSALIWCSLGMAGFVFNSFDRTDSTGIDGLDFGKALVFKHANDLIFSHYDLTPLGFCI
jgi:hypothetical protein